LPKREVPVPEGIAVGNNGWIRYQSQALEPADVFVRFVDRDGRLVAAEIYVVGPDEGLEPEKVRRLPIGRIEAWANEPTMAHHIRDHVDLPAPDLRRAISYFMQLVDDLNPPDPNWVDRMLLAQISGSDEPQAPMGKVDRLPKTAIVEVPDPPNAKLKVPVRRPYPAAFFKEVARVYAALSARERGPAGVIADANGVPVSSVHRWVKRARALGFLPPGQRGRAG
jgi:hypothetical protein